MALREALITEPHTTFVVVEVQNWRGAPRYEVRLRVEMTVAGKRLVEEVGVATVTGKPVWRSRSQKRAAALAEDLNRRMRIERFMRARRGSWVS